MTNQTVNERGALGNNAHPKRRSRARPEDAIQRAVFLHLRTRPALGVFAFHPANGGKRERIEASILKGLGVVAGVPDVIAIRSGHVYATEQNELSCGKLHEVSYYIGGETIIPTARIPGMWVWREAIYSFM